MKANELRIGNWVQTTEGYKRVAELDKYGIAYHMTFDAVKLALCKYLKPIPLTEEILLKCGFEKIEEEFDGHTDLHYILKVDSFCTLVLCDDFSFSFQDEKLKEQICVKNDTLNSVHRLQNLYFVLTGEELEIEL